MKIWKASQILFLAALAAILLLTACTSTVKPEGNDTSTTPDTAIGDTSGSVRDESDEDTSDTEKEEEDLPQQPEEDIESEQEAAYDTVETWQEVYISLLGTIRTENTGNHLGLDDDSYTEYDAESYQLYDIDKDGIPELIVEYGKVSNHRFKRWFENSPKRADYIAA